MSKIEYDPSLIEQAVNHAVYGDPKLEAALHRRTDPLYGLRPSSGRDRMFGRIYATFFEQLGLARTLPRLLEERPLIADSVRLR